MRIAILGAGSYVSRAILPYLLRRSDWEALLYTRAPDHLKDWAVERHLPAERISIEASDAFGGRPFDVVVNLIGAGDPRLVVRMGDGILALTAEWDERVLQQVKKRPSTRYIFASSGAAAGGDFDTPRTQGAPLRQPAGHDHYARAKADAEERHRALGDLSITDLRLYNFYSADMGAELGYLVCSMLQNVLDRSTFVSDEHDIARDYLHPEDLSTAMMAVLRSTPQNGAFDLASLGPVRKFELLRRFDRQFGLKWQIRPSDCAPNKINYYSEDLSLRALGFEPKFSAMEAVIDQATAFLAKTGCLPQVEPT
jgi:nucleoside-diphosphate-sugar epimerase